MRKNLIVAVASAAIATGCASPVPVAENFPLSYQKVARTSHHWDVVADDVVEQTTGAIKEIASLNGRPIYLSPAAVNTVFDAAFHDFLLNRMVTRGVTVNVCPAKQTAGLDEAPPVQVNYSARVVEHSASMSAYRPGALTALGLGVVAAHGLEGASLPVLYGTGAGLLALADIAAGQEALPTRTEIIVTTTIVENNHYLTRRSDVYYVPDADAHLFSDRAARTDDCPGVVTNSARLEIEQQKLRSNARLEWLSLFRPE